MMEEKTKEILMDQINNFQITKPLLSIYSICDSSGCWHRLKGDEYIDMNKLGRFVEEIDHNSDLSTVPVSFTFKIIKGKPIGEYHIKGQFTGKVDYETGRFQISFNPAEENEIGVSGLRVYILTPHISKRD